MAGADEHSNALHSRKRTWMPKMMVWKGNLRPLKMAMFAIYVRFLGCIS